MRKRSEKESINRGRRMDLLSKKGSLVVEASIILPPFIVGMILLLSILPAITSAEAAVFTASNELIKADARTIYLSEPISVPLMVRNKIKNENPRISRVILLDYGYRYSEGGMDDLISMELLLTNEGVNPLGRISAFGITIKLMSRALTGTKMEMDGNEEQFTLNESYKAVSVFPRSGEKYHSRGCPFLNPDCRLVYLTESIRSTNTPCSNCHSERAAVGTPVFCFSGANTDYHFGSCNAVTKYFIEMDEGEAVEKGYSPCMTCGG